MTKNFEVGQSVTVDSDDYLNSLPGVILDVTASGYDGTFYCVEVEEQGTHYFYASNLSVVEKQGQSVVY